MSFSLQRLFYLLRANFREKGSVFHQMILLVLGVWVLLFMLKLFFLPGFAFLSGGVAFWRITLFLSSAYLAKLSFSRFHASGTLPNLLLLPVSRMEHFVAAWVMSVIVPLVGVMLLFVFCVSVISPLLAFIFGVNLTSSLLFDSSVFTIENIFYYLFWTAAFMLSSVTFKQGPIVKLILFFLGFGVVMLVCVIFILLTVFVELVSLNPGLSIQENIYLDGAGDFYPWWLMLLLTLGLYVCTILKINEKES